MRVALVCGLRYHNKRVYLRVGKSLCMKNPKMEDMMKKKSKVVGILLRQSLQEYALHWHAQRVQKYIILSAAVVSIAEITGETGVQR